MVLLSEGQIYLGRIKEIREWEPASFRPQLERLYFRKTFPISSLPVPHLFEQLPVTLPPRAALWLVGDSKICFGNFFTLGTISKTWTVCEDLKPCCLLCCSQDTEGANSELQMGGTPPVPPQIGVQGPGQGTYHKNTLCSFIPSNCDNLGPSADLPPHCSPSFPDH